MTTFKYYLTNVLLFSNFDFSLKTITMELFFLLGIILLNSAFKGVRRSVFLKLNGFFYVLTNVLLIPMLFHLKTHPEIPPLVFILLYTGLHSLFFEIFSLPIISIFLEICPENLEGFFMSLIFFMNNFSRNVGHFLGTICIFALKIAPESLNQFSLLIAIHCAVSFVGFSFLLFSHIPPKKQIPNEEPIEEFDNNYLAFIKTKDSIVFEDYQPFDRETGSLRPHDHKKSVLEERRLVVTSLERMASKGDFVNQLAKESK